MTAYVANEMSALENAGRIVGHSKMGGRRQMVYYAESALEWSMKVQEVILKAMSGEILWVDVAEILGISTRSMRR